MAKKAKSSLEETEVFKAYAEEWELAMSGQLRVLEDRAADAARRAVREEWLPILQKQLSELMSDPAYNLSEAAILMGEIKRLRRVLKIGPSIEERRAATNERVARWRQRQREQHA